MFCANCGVKIENTLKFCPACGTPTANASKTAEDKRTAPFAVDSPAPVRKTSSNAKWLIGIVGLIAVAALMKMCSPASSTQPSPTQVDAAAQAALGQSVPSPNASARDILAATISREQPTLPRRVDQYTTFQSVELVGGNRMRMFFRINSPNTPVETSQQIDQVMRQKTTASDCSTPDRRHVIDLGGEFEYRYFNMDGSHEYGGFVVNKSSCADNPSGQASYSRDGVTNTLKMSTDAVGVEASLQALAKQVERDAPIRVDSTTQLVGPTANAKTIRYILHAAIPGSRDEVIRSINAKMVAFTRANYCASPAQFKILEDGAVILYEFRSEDGREFYATIPVSRQSCDGT